MSNPYDNNIPEEAPICSDYIDDTYKASAAMTLSNWLINIANMVIKIVVYKLLMLTGCSTESTRDSIITKYVFICYLMNTGFFLLLVNANFNGQFTKDGNSFAENIFNG